MHSDRSRQSYVDLQINGCFGVDFNSLDLTPPQWREVTGRLGVRGVRSFLATLITDHLEPLCRKIELVASLIESEPADDAEAECIGIHVEGPFLSSVAGYVGAHRGECTCDADPASVQRVIEAGRGHVRMVTLAPERVRDLRAVELLRRAGILIAAGHTDASFEQLRAAIDAGLTAFTHLGNGCPVLLPRHDNIIARAWALADRLNVTMIADGIHVPAWWLDACIRHFGFDRVAIISDAMAAAGLGPGAYHLGNQSVQVDSRGRATLDDSGNLAGAARLMDEAESLLRDQLGYSPEQIRSMTSDNPREWLAQSSRS